MSAPIGTLRDECSTAFTFVYAIYKKKKVPHRSTPHSISTTSLHPPQPPRPAPTAPTRRNRVATRGASLAPAANSSTTARRPNAGTARSAGSSTTRARVSSAQRAPRVGPPKAPRATSGRAYGNAFRAAGTTASAAATSTFRTKLARSNARSAKTRERLAASPATRCPAKSYSRRDIAGACTPPNRSAEKRRMFTRRLESPLEHLF